MRSQARSRKNRDIEIKELYALKPKMLWAAMKQQHASFWFLCIYFFFEYVRPQTLYPVLDILPYAQILLIASVLSAFSDPSVKWVSNVESKILILFSIVLVLSGIFAFRPAESLEYWSVFGSWFVVYFLVINIVNNEKRMLLFLLIYCLFNLKMSQHGAFDWAARGFSFASYGLVGSPGWFRNSGEYAIQMLIFGSLMISIVVALHDYWGRNKKIVMYLIAATGYMAVMGASSRGAQLGIAAIGIWFLLKYRSGIKTIIIIFVVAASLYYLLPEEQIQRFRDMGSDETSLQRLAYWEFAFDEVIPEFPFIGIGYHNWLSYANFQRPEGLGPQMFVQEPHNIYVQAASELGFIGLFLFLLLVMFAFLLNARTRIYANHLDSKLMYNIAFGLDAGLIGYLVAGTFVSVFYYPFFWVQMSMIVMLYSVSKNQLFNKESLINYR